MANGCWRLSSRVLLSIFYFRLSSIVYYTRIHAHQFSAAPCRRMCRSTVSTTRITPTPPSTPPSAPSARRSVGPFERHSQLEVGDLPEKVCGWDSGGRRARASVGMMHLTTRPRDIGACADPQTRQSWARGRRRARSDCPCAPSDRYRAAYARRGRTP